MKPIVDMNQGDLLNLSPDTDIILGKDELLHIFKTFDAFWAYDDVAAKAGRVGKHAELKSGLCSNGFFYSKIVLDYPNLRKIIASNMVRQYQLKGLVKPDYVAGIPKGATKLGRDVAEIFGVKNLDLIKDSEGRIKVVGSESIKAESTLLLVEDFSSTGSGFSETVIEIKSHYPHLDILPVELVILNRGDIEYIPVGEYGFFDILALVNHKIDSWEEDDCPLCENGSKRIKPKSPESNWPILVNSQKQN